jgi:outer membrane protein TolC
VGLSLSLPINNRTAAGNYLKAKYDEEMARLDTEVLRQNITVEVREALRALTLARESVKATGKTRVASEKRLNAEQERFRLGMAILNDVLRFQEEYATALSSEKRALVDYAKAAVNLRKATGALLENQVAARR